MKFATLAALACSQAAAVENRAAINLVADAMASVQEGTEAHAHLANAMESLTDAKFTDAEILASHSQLVSVPIDEKRALALKVSQTYTLDTILQFLVDTVIAIPFILTAPLFLPVILASQIPPSFLRDIRDEPFSLVTFTAIGLFQLYYWLTLPFAFLFTSLWVSSLTSCPKDNNYIDFFINGMLGPILCTLLR